MGLLDDRTPAFRTIAPPLLGMVVVLALLAFLVLPAARPEAASVTGAATAATAPRPDRPATTPELAPLAAAASPAAAPTSTTPAAAPPGVR